MTADPLAAEVLRLAPFAARLVEDAGAGRIAWADLLEWAGEWAAERARRVALCRCGKPALCVLCDVCRGCLEAEEVAGGTGDRD